MISKKKVFAEIETGFSAKIRNSNAFLYRITTSTSQLRHPISFGGGGCFQFFTKYRPQKHQKRAILHTSQANRGARAPLPPLATLLGSAPRPPKQPPLEDFWLPACVDHMSVQPDQNQKINFSTGIFHFAMSKNFQISCCYNLEFRSI